jgi:hypothetical protein
MRGRLTMPIGRTGRRLARDRWAVSECKAAAVAANSRGTRAVGVALGVLLATASIESQSNTFDVAFHAFQDSRDVTVLSPDISMERTLNDRTALRAKFGLDAISSPSEACVNCHPKGPTNRRLAGSLSLVRKFGDTKLTVGSELSKEYFYASGAFLASLSRDLNKGNTTVAAGFSVARNVPTLHPSEARRTQTSYGAYGSLTQSWTRSTVTQIGYEFNDISGYLANPFLRNHIDGFELHDRVPAQRTRHALSARLRQALTSGTFLDSDYRHYADSWSLQSDTLSVGLAQHLGQVVVASGRYRWYDQEGAFFYAPSYSGLPEYLTSDFRLVPFTSGAVEGRIEVTPKRSWLSMPAGSSLSFELEHYFSSQDFQANILTIGLRLPFK